MSDAPDRLDVQVAMDTDIGRRRKQNQDAIGHMVPPDPAVLERLGQVVVLADGVGGLAGGDLASQYAVSTILRSYYEQEEGDPSERLIRAIAEANHTIFAESQGQDKPGIMATTVVAAVICDRDLVIGSVGDSPAYLMRDASVRKLTLDHTVREMQRQAGHPMPAGDPAGRKLVRALGTQASVKVDITTGRVRGGDHVVLCSDGLTRYVTPQEIEGIVTTRSPQNAVRALIDLANERGGADNVSVIVLRLLDPLAGDVESEFRPPGEDESTVHAVPRSVIQAAVERAQADYTRLHQPPVEMPAPRSAPRRPPRENPLRDLWQILRGNLVASAVGMGVLLVLFVGIMLIVSTAGDEGASPGQRAALETPSPAPGLTDTAAAQAAMTAQAAARQTDDVLQLTQVAQAATAALLTQTPPPPAGPQMAKDDWFRVLPGEPIPAFKAPDVNAEAATPLEGGANFLIQEVNSAAWNGPWYFVLDNQGAEARWVNGPSLHQRVLRVAPSGEPLPPEQQPTDLAPGVLSPTPIPTPTPAPLPDGSTPSPAPTLAVPYAADVWTPGTRVYAQVEFKLRETPSLQGIETDPVAVGEAADVVQGPVAMDGHWWWRLQFANGRNGWVAQPLLSYQPVSPP